MTGLPGFDVMQVATNCIRLSVHRAGSGPAMILLHGYPQNHMTWAKIAPRLAQDFDVIVPDLRGYGASDMPPADAEMMAYSKREMARDIVGMIEALGLSRAHIVGHDRGARVAYRLALDHPARVDRLAILEVVPTGDFWAAWTADLAVAAWHWTFLAQPAPLPERMILADGRAFTDWILERWSRTHGLTAFLPEALATYRAQGSDPARVAAMCNDYRAGATIDRALDLADAVAGRQITAPMLYLWSEHGFPARTGDPLGIWRDWAPDLTGEAIPGAGHFLPEEAPEATLAALLRYFKGA